MTGQVNVLHVTPHLGGGVGKALNTLIVAQRESRYRHSFLMLEQPQKRQWLDELEGLGARVEIASDESDTRTMTMLGNADIVQLEWWNHPATFNYLCRNRLPAMRLLVWCHVSGLHTPVIPRGLLAGAGRFVFTSHCSMQVSMIADLDEKERARIGVVGSGVGLSDPRVRTPCPNHSLRVGYIGSLNFSKLHPRYIDYLNAVDVPGFKVTLWGDLENQDILLDQCRRSGRLDLIECAGFASDVAVKLASLDVLAYLLNPYHYGTAENALLEAMSARVVPIVLGNPAECAIVRNGRTGFVLDSPQDFAKAITFLLYNPEERERIGRNASDWVSTNFNPEILGQGMAREYEQVLCTEKESLD